MTSGLPRDNISPEMRSYLNELSQRLNSSAPDSGGVDAIFYRSADNEWVALTIGSNLTFLSGTLDGVAAVAAASSAEMEAATSTAVFASPGTTKSHPGVAKFWAKVDAAGNILASYNVSSVTVNGTGDLTVTIDTDFSSADWCCQVSVMNNAQRYVRVNAQASGSCQIIVQTSAPAAGDPIYYYVSGFGDQ